MLTLPSVTGRGSNGAGSQSLPRIQNNQTPDIGGIGNVNKSPYVTAFQRDGANDYDDMGAASPHSSTSWRQLLDDKTALLELGLDVELPNELEKV